MVYQRDPGETRYGNAPRHGEAYVNLAVEKAQFPWQA